MLASRYEWKYSIPDFLVPSVRTFIQPFVTLDQYAQKANGGRYSICSLYLDSANLELCDQTRRGERNRFKLRIRNYRDDITAPAFLEIKRKVDRVVRKRRAAVSGDAVARLLRSGLSTAEPLCRSVRDEIGEFLSLVSSMHAIPIAQIAYEREAYESSAGDPVRITFDTALRYRVVSDCRLSWSGDSWKHVPLGGTILEVKYTERFPSWIPELIRCFELQRRSVAKYVMSMDSAAEQGFSAVLIARHRGIRS